MDVHHIILIFFFFTLVGLSSASQANQLRDFIESKRSSSSSRDLVKLEFSLLYIGPQEGLMEADRITRLPGQPELVGFDQFAGHVTVDPINGRALFYYFVEAAHDPASKPLLLWLNGGPGCSSLGYGAMEELGPFRVHIDGKTLLKNSSPWNNVANVIFLESPAGVGFSYSNTTSDYALSGDNMTARDSYVFLLNWLERFPQYKLREFYIIGESYAGHYVPQLANTILHQNKITNRTVINLRGVAVGNAYIDWYANNIGHLEYMWSHALISDETYALILKKCDFSMINRTEECENAYLKAAEGVGEIDDYDIYAPLCDQLNRLDWSGRSYMAGFDPCSDNHVTTYFNNPEVQIALHANPAAAPHQWQICRVFNWTGRLDSMHPILKELIASGIRVWLYSGDTDAVVSVTSTRYSLRMLGLAIETPWRPWYCNKQVGGYVVKYKGLTFATVRGAGHDVPSYQPERALVLITSFLKDELPPSS